MSSSKVVVMLRSSWLCLLLVVLAIVVSVHGRELNMVEQDLMSSIGDEHFHTPPVFGEA